MAVIFVFNLVIGSNYLFIAHKPVTASLMDVLPPWPVYIIFLELIGAVMSLILYLPFQIRDWPGRLNRSDCYLKRGCKIDEFAPAGAKLPKSLVFVPYI